MRDSLLKQATVTLNVVGKAFDRIAEKLRQLENVTLAFGYRPWFGLRSAFPRSP